MHEYCGFINIHWTLVFVHEDFVVELIHETKYIHYGAISHNILHVLCLIWSLATNLRILETVIFTLIIEVYAQLIPVLHNDATVCVFNACTRAHAVTVIFVSLFTQKNKMQPR